MKFFSQLIRVFIKDSAKFSSIKNSDKAEKSVYFGIVGILSAVLGCAISVGFVLGGATLIENVGNSDNVLVAIFVVIIGATLALSGVLGFVMCSIRGIMAASFQLRLKRKATGIIALILNIAILITIIILIYLILVK